MYLGLSLRSFVEAFSETAGSDSSFTLPAVELAHIVPVEEVDYGLSLLREAILLYEREKGIAEESGKSAMPFFRQGTRVLVGPEVGMYVIPLSERSREPAATASGASLTLELDYASLGEHCLFENYSLLACKYDRTRILERFTTLLETEYDKFFFDEEHTGFTPDSRFFSMLCEACLEVRRSELAEEKEWRLVVFKSPAEVEYRYERGDLIPYTDISLPVSCLRRIHLDDYRRNPSLFGTLNGFLKSKGLPAERLLNLT